MEQAFEFMWQNKAELGTFLTLLLESLVEILWQSNSEPGKLLTLLIVMLGLAAVFCARKHTRRYAKKEPHALEEVRLRLQREAEAHPQQLVSLSSLLEPVQSGQSLIADRLMAITKMRQAHVKVSVSALQQMSLLRENSILGLTLPGYVASVTLMIGLLGTFIGLALMAQQIQISLPDIAGSAANVSDATWEQSVQNLGKIVTGMKTAFSTTLVGLIGSILVSALNFQLARAQSGFYDRLERFTSEELLPHTVPAVEDANLLEEVSLQLDRGFARLDALTQDHTHNIAHLQAIEAAFGSIIENIKVLTHRDASTNSTDFVSGMTTVVQQLTQVNRIIISLTEQIPRLSSDFQKTQQETLRQLGALLQRQHDRMERLFSRHLTRLHRSFAPMGLPAEVLGGKAFRLLSLALLGAALVLFLSRWMRVL